MSKSYPLRVQNKFTTSYGGLFITAPEKHPLNKRTKLAFGDTLRIGLYMIVTGLFSFFGQVWLRWYEVDYGEWGPDDYDMFGKHIPDILDVFV